MHRLAGMNDRVGKFHRTRPFMRFICRDTRMREILPKKGRIVAAAPDPLASEVADRRTFLQPVYGQDEGAGKPCQVDFFPRSQETVAKWTTGREAERLYSCSRGEESITRPDAM